MAVKWQDLTWEPFYEKLTKEDLDKLVGVTGELFGDFGSDFSTRKLMDKVWEDIPVPRVAFLEYLSYFTFVDTLSLKHLIQDFVSRPLEDMSSYLFKAEGLPDWQVWIARWRVAIQK